MPKAKRRKNIFGFGRKSSANYIPASGGIAKHAPKHRAKSKAVESDSKYDDVAKSLAGKPYKSLSSTQQATVRGIASKMNPKRKRTGRRVAKARRAGDSAKADYYIEGQTKRWYDRKKRRTGGPVGTLPNPKRKRNVEIGLPKNQFVNAKVRMKGGKIQVMADERVLGKAGFKAGAGLSGVSVSGGAKLNPNFRKGARVKFWNGHGYVTGRVMDGGSSTVTVGHGPRDAYQTTRVHTSKLTRIGSKRKK